MSINNTMILSYQELNHRVESNFETACKLSMSVVSVFYKDPDADVVYLTANFCQNAVKLIEWKINYLKYLNQLNVPFMCYVGDCLDEAHYYLQLDE